MYSVHKYLVGLMLVVFLSACGDGLNSGDYVEKSKGLLAESKLAGAVIEAKNALKENASNFEAHKVLGDIYMKQGRPLLGEVQYRKLMELGADKSIWLPGLLKSYFSQRKFAEILSVKTENLDKQTQSVLLSYQAQSLVYTGRVKEAGKLFDKLDSLNVSGYEVILAKANYLRKTNKYDEAKTLLLSLISREPNNDEAYLRLGNLEFQLQNYDLGEAAYSKAYLLNPENKQVLIQRANLRFSNNKMELAQNDISELLKVYPKASKVNLIQGLILLKKNKIEQATPFLELSVNSSEPPIRGLFALAKINLKKGDIEQAVSYSSKLLKIAPSVPSYVLAAQVKISQRKWLEAESDLLVVLNKTPDNVTALNLLAIVHLGKGELTKAVKAYEKVAKLAPDNTKSNLQMGVVLMSQGKFSNSLEHLKIALSAEPNNTLVESMVAQNYILRKDFHKAKDVVKGLKAKYPKRAFPFVLSGNIFNLLNDKVGAKKALKEGCDIEPSDLDSCLNYAKLALKEKELDEAERVYKLILISYPKNYAALIKLANISLLRGNKEEMVSRLNGLISTFPGLMEPRLLLGWHLYGENKYNDIESIFSSISVAKKKSSLPYHELMASVFVDLQKFLQAKVHVKKVLEVNPKNEKGLFLSAMINKGEGDKKGTVSGFKKILQLYPNNAPARLMLIKALLANNNIDEVKANLKKLEKIPLMEIESLKIKSRLSERSGNVDEAVSYAKRVIGKAPTEKNIITLGRLLWRGSKKGDAILVLIDGKTQHPKSLSILLELASYYSLDGDEDDALIILEDVIKKNPKQTTALNNAAWILRQRDTKKALEYATRLIDIDSDNHGYLDTLAMVYYHNEDIDRANRNILRAIDIQPKPTYVFHKAMIDNKKGEWLMAIKSLSSLLEKDISFPERKKAEELLATLKAAN